MTTPPSPPLIFGQMSKIMAEVQPIAKERRSAQGYSFRGVDDLYLALQGVMAKHGVFSVPTVLDERTEDRQSKGGGLLIYRVLKIRYDFYAVDGSSVPCTVIGEGMDSSDKASNKAMSVADKYALLQAFKIPTEEPKDPENDNLEPLPKDPECHNHDNLDDRNYLTEKLKSLKINPNLWVDISQAFHGKKKTPEEFKRAVTLVSTRRYTSSVEGAGKSGPPPTGPATTAEAPTLMGREPTK